MNLADDQWERIAHPLPGKQGKRCCHVADNRFSVEAVLWMARSGVHWRDLPQEVGLWNGAYRRFGR